MAKKQSFIHICKVCTTLMVKPIVDQCALYIVQNSVCSTYYDLYKSTD